MLRVQHQQQCGTVEHELAVHKQEKERLRITHRYAYILSTESVYSVIFTNVWEETV